VIGEAATHLATRSTTYRTTTLYSTEQLDERWLAHRVHTAEPVFELFPATSYYRRWYEAGREQLPRVVHTAECDPVRLRLSQAANRLTLHRARTWLFALPYGGFVAGLTLDFEDLVDPARVRALPELLADVDAGRHELRMGEQPYLAVCLGDPVGQHHLALGADMHHLTFVTSPSARGPAGDKEALQRLVSRRDDPSREEFLTARFPAEANRYANMFLAVTPGATATGGQGADVELAFTLSAVQALSSLALLRDIQGRAYSALGQRRGPEDTTQIAWLRSREKELGELELDLSFGVEAHLDLRILVPSLPVEQYHHELVELLALPRGARVTGTMLARLSTALAVERADLEDRRAAAGERRLALLSTIGGAVAFVAVPLGVLFAYLGTNVAEVGRDHGQPSLLDLGHYGPAYFVIVTLLGLGAVLGFLVARRLRPMS
jgi:hypothetical protein